MVKIFTLFLGLMFVSVSINAQANKPLWLRFSAISPDGSEICFSYNGDLWIVPVNGGKARALTRHVATDRQPIWSNDGKTIAFASDRHGNFDVFTIPSEGGAAKRITSHSNAEYPSAFSMDDSFIYFYASRLDDAANAQFPSAALPETYQISSKGGNSRILIHTGSQLAKPSKDGLRFLYQDRKGYEDEFRKHHISSITRDIWLFEPLGGKHTRLTAFEGEDREPVWGPDDKEFYWLSEKSGSLNVWKQAAQANASPTQITNFSKHPVRYLSVSTNGTICFSYHGEIYIQTAGASEPKKVEIDLSVDASENALVYKLFSSQATEMAVSPNGKEIAFVVRGEIFVTSIDYDITKRITNTPEQERNISFSPDGRSILFAAERFNNLGESNWDIWQTSIVNKNEPYFFKSTHLKEDKLIGTKFEEFQPAYSPDGKEVAYLEERVKLKVFNIESGKTRMILDSTFNYSYSDGDQHYHWSPDGNYFIVQFIDKQRWVSEIGLISSKGDGKIVNITESGYRESSPMWMQQGKSAIWFSDRYGMRSHGSWGSQVDVIAAFFTRESFEEFQLSKDEYELKKLIEKAEKSKKEKDDKTEKKDDKEITLPGVVKPKKIEPVNIEVDDLHYRTLRLTTHSSNLSGAALTDDGSRLYYLSRIEKGYDLWVHKLREKETKLLAKLEKGQSSLEIGPDGKIYVLGGGKLMQIDTAAGKVKPIPFKAEMEVRPSDERAYMFDHAWRQTLKKFYLVDMHGVDWEGLKKEYSIFLPHTANGHDFADMLGEMLGELNASHTGGRYNPPINPELTDQTASLGIYTDNEYGGKGIRIVEVMKRSPFDNSASNVKKGSIIEVIDGTLIDGTFDWVLLLNRKHDKPIRVEGKDPSGKSFSEVVKPISLAEETELRYTRWVEQRKAYVARLSGGKVGYVHVRGMNDASFREVYSEALGRMYNTDAIIIDTRFNGGGWLHDDLATLFSGKQYVKLIPRGQVIGSEPQGKWQKPSLMLMSESNYSDAHFSPYTYRALGVGKLVGMPVPGTTTAVWWERMIDGTVFGIPQVGVIGLDGAYLENQQLEPDVRVNNTYEKLAVGIDEQLEKSVELLLQEINLKK